jgi:hypothetical protein
VLDEPYSLTFIPDLVTTAEQFIQRRAMGIFHVVNPGALSPYDVMRNYQDVVDASHRFEVLRAHQMGQVANTGRSSCRLSVAKLLAMGIRLRDAGDALQLALASIARLKTGKHRPRMCGGIQLYPAAQRHVPAAGG